MVFKVSPAALVSWQRKHSTRHDILDCMLILGVFPLHRSTQKKIRTGYASTSFSCALQFKKAFIESLACKTNKQTKKMVNGILFYMILHKWTRYGFKSAHLFRNS